MSSPTNTDMAPKQSATPVDSKISQPKKNKLDKGLPPIIQAKNLRVTYPNSSVWQSLRGEPGYTALKDVNFEVKPGGRLGLLGRNGSGKSTLLRTLAGVYPPSGGDLLVRGTRSSIFNATSGFVPNATGRENIMLRGVILGLTREQIRDLTPSIIEFSELKGWIDQPIYTYSSGMTLRLAFSIVTALQNDILLMDEWIGAGDAGFIDKAQKRMDYMLENSQIIVLASHNMPLMQRVCERAIVIEEGAVLFDGDVKEAIAIYRDIRDHKA
ncbi:MAG: ABC transporter ATP-binding protein [Litorimonas sp.]